MWLPASRTKLEPNSCILPKHWPWSWASSVLPRVTAQIGGMPWGGPVFHFIPDLPWCLCFCRKLRSLAVPLPLPAFSSDSAALQAPFTVNRLLCLFLILSLQKRKAVGTVYLRTCPIPCTATLGQPRLRPSGQLLRQPRLAGGCAPDTCPGPLTSSADERVAQVPPTVLASSSGTWAGSALERLPTTRPHALHFPVFLTLLSPGWSPAPPCLLPMGLCLSFPSPITGDSGVFAGSMK